MHLQGLWLFARGEVDQGAKRPRDQTSVGFVQIRVVQPDESLFASAEAHVPDQFDKAVNGFTKNPDRNRLQLHRRDTVVTITRLKQAHDLIFQVGSSIAWAYHFNTLRSHFGPSLRNGKRAVLFCLLRRRRRSDAWGNY